jgi:hypothetical protein
VVFVFVVVVVVVVAVVPVVPVIDVSVVPVVLVIDVSVVVGIAAVSVVPIVAEVLDIAVPDVSVVVIVDDVSLAAVSLTFTFSSFLHANMKKARAITMRIARLLFICVPFLIRKWGWKFEKCEQTSWVPVLTSLPVSSVNLTGKS